MFELTKGKRLFKSMPSLSCFNLLFLFPPGNVSRNCTSQGWTDVYPAPYAVACGYDSNSTPGEEVCKPRWMDGCHDLPGIDSRVTQPSGPLFFHSCFNSSKKRDPLGECLTEEPVLPLNSCIVAGTQHLRSDAYLY